MSYTTLATDYDGTLAHDGRVDGATLDALARARRRGIRLLLVTGRELDDLLVTFPALAAMDHVVAENGAVLYDPHTRVVERLAPPPPPALLDGLRAAGVPFSAGQAIVATVEPHGAAMAAVITALGLPWHLTPNKGAVMALPTGITKATGLAALLERLRLPAEEVVAVGDAENDLALLRACGLGVAVSNALPGVKEAADLVTAAARGAGVVELLDRLIGGTLPEPRRPGGLTRAGAATHG